MDAQRLSPLPRLPRRAGRARRIQRQIHVQSDGSARRLMRDVPRSYPLYLPEFFPTGETLAVHRHPARAQPVMTAATDRVAVLDLEPVKADFLAEVIAGLSSSP